MQPAVPFTSRDLLPRLAHDLAPVVDALTGLSRLQRVYEDALARCPGVPFIDVALRELSVDVDIASDALARVPTAGPLLVVANHPHGIVDGLVVAHALRRMRTDVRMVGNELLARIPEMREHLIAVNTFRDGARNVRGLRAALEWLRAGHVLVVFPAGAVSHVPTLDGRIVDAAWRNGAARLATSADAPVLPIFIGGANSRLFRLAGRVHPALRTALLPREFLRQRGRTITLHVGRPITARRLAVLNDASARTAYLRALTYRLAPEIDTRRRSLLTIHKATRRQAVAEEIDRSTLAGEIEALPERASVLTSGDWSVYVADAPDIPQALLEIGRLREIAFRAAGEGTGQARDLDRFDRHYRHLFVWHRGHQLIGGAYRVAPTDRVIARHGVHGLYTRTLFRYPRRLLDEMGPAFELGRSFVRPEFQRDYQPLLLLWKGIGRLVASEPRYRMLFGPVSISADYGTTTRHLLARFLLANRYHTELGSLVRPRRPLREDLQDGAHALVRSTVVATMEDVETLVRDLEADRRGMPVLLRQYLKLKGKLLGFSVDPTFGHVLDGLIVVDLTTVASALLAKYLGKEDARRFLALHSSRDGAFAPRPSRGREPAGAFSTS